MNMTNLFENIPSELPEELVEVLASSENIRIERIVSYGQSSDKDFWYDQEQNEFVLLLKGQAELEFTQPNKIFKLAEGDSLVIPAHQQHRVNWTAPKTKTIWLVVFYG